MITITLTIKDQSDGKTTDIDCKVSSEEPTNTEAAISNIINNAARSAFEDYLRGTPNGGQIIQRASKGTPPGRQIKPPGL